LKWIKNVRKSWISQKTCVVHVNGYVPIRWIPNEGKKHKKNLIDRRYESVLFQYNVFTKNVKLKSFSSVSSTTSRHHLPRPLLRLLRYLHQNRPHRRRHRRYHYHRLNNRHRLRYPIHLRPYSRLPTFLLSKHYCTIRHFPNIRTVYNNSLDRPGVNKNKCDATSN
jgi:hypothetical protein